MIGQFWVLLCPVPVHRGLYLFKERKIARCGWLGGRGESFLIINGRDGPSAHPPGSFRCDHFA
ncbi:hypothetical protein T05_13262 [Trichinella murrelli]|uniref:Uncharacterized protein n=1 Tax=Trichinella murrelli TaxID=144512 RepID=A0A0V0T275_9BILA|nr:hypothetical protein T05_3329 [Trichinella murrelli]KRX34771.1 hypothetical protein T05_13262 [Trichinella murrelli]